MHPEPELGAVIGTRLHNASPKKALAGVFGYTLVNDVTSPGIKADDDRSLYLTYHARSKGTDTLTPIGPWVTLAENVSDSNDLEIRSYLDDSTANLTFPIETVLSHLSQSMTLWTPTARRHITRRDYRCRDPPVLHSRIRRYRHVSHRQPSRVHSGSICRAFGSKQGLLDAVMTRVADRAFTAVETISHDTAASLGDRLRRTAHSLIADPVLLRLFLLLALEKVDDTDVRASVGAARATVTTALTSLLEQP